MKLTATVVIIKMNSLRLISRFFSYKCGVLHKSFEENKVFLFLFCFIVGSYGTYWEWLLNQGSYFSRVTSQKNFLTLWSNPVFKNVFPVQRKQSDKIWWAWSKLLATWYFLLLNSKENITELFWGLGFSSKLVALCWDLIKPTLLQFQAGHCWGLHLCLVKLHFLIKVGQCYRKYWIFFFQD